MDAAYAAYAGSRIDACTHHLSGVGDFITGEAQP